MIEIYLTKTILFVHWFIFNSIQHKKVNEKSRRIKESSKTRKKLQTTSDMFN